MNTLPLVSFPLSLRLHVESGWTDLVRHYTTRKPEVISHLLTHRDVLPPCDDPSTLLENWWPLGNVCVFFIRCREKGSLAELVITDGVFNQILPARRMIPRPGQVAEPFFDGLLGAVLSTARNAWTSAHPGDPSPLLPGETGFPEAAILHRYEENVAFVAPYAATLSVLTSKEPL